MIRQDRHISMRIVVIPSSHGFYVPSVVSVKVSQFSYQVLTGFRVRGYKRNKKSDILALNDTGVQIASVLSHYRRSTQSQCFSLHQSVFEDQK